LQLFVSNAQLRFLGFVQAPPESRFAGTHDAIRRQVVAVGNRFAAGELALRFLIVDAADSREIGAAVRAVAGTSDLVSWPFGKPGARSGGTLSGVSVVPMESS